MSGTTSFSANEATNIQFWKRLCPELSIEGNVDFPNWNFPKTDSLLQQIQREGYVRQADVIPESVTQKLHSCIDRLSKNNIPLVYAFVYDEFWLIYRSLFPVLKQLLGDGYRMNPGIWAWLVEPSDAATGWRPHRDQLHAPPPDNLPTSITVWLPLTDANELNGCMYVLPLHLDDNFKNYTRWEASAADFAVKGEQLQNIRALPAKAGSVLMWSGLLMHWGSRASNLGTSPRCSIAIEFQRGDRPPLDLLLMNPKVIPPFLERLGIIGYQITRYAKFRSITDPQMLLIAAALQWKYFPKK